MKNRRLCARQTDRVMLVFYKNGTKEEKRKESERLGEQESRRGRERECEIE